MQYNNDQTSQDYNHEAISNKVESLDVSLGDGIQTLDKMKNYPLSENGFEEDNHLEVSKQLMQLMKDLEVDVAVESQGKSQTNNSLNQKPLSKVELMMNQMKQQQLME